MANAVTIGRIALSFALMMPVAFSPAFFLVYALAGLTDILDGCVARRANSVSELGARLDSIADLALAVVCLEKVLPVIDVPAWLWAWIAAIALVKAANVASGHGIWAKDIADVMVELSSQSDLDKAAETLERSGFTMMSDEGERVSLFKTAHSGTNVVM